MVIFWTPKIARHTHAAALSLDAYMGAMKKIDTILQRWRFRQAIPWIGSGKRVLDIGCYHGELFDLIGEDVVDSVGIDSRASSRRGRHWRLMPLKIGESLPFDPASFDVITLFATIEHLPPPARSWKECLRVLAPEGRLVVTVPGPWVDAIVDGLVALNLADGMENSHKEHTGIEPLRLAKEIESAGFDLLHHSRFQLGLNNLFVFTGRS